MRWCQRRELELDTSYRSSTRSSRPAQLRTNRQRARGGWTEQGGDQSPDITVQRAPILQGWCGAVRSRAEPCVQVCSGEVSCRTDPAGFSGPVSREDANLVPYDRCMPREKAWERRKVGGETERETGLMQIAETDCTQATTRILSCTILFTTILQERIHIYIDTNRFVVPSTAACSLSILRATKFIRISFTRITSQFDASAPTQPSIVFTDRYSEHYTATLGYIHGTEQTGCRYFGGKVSTDSNSDSNSPACFGDFFCGIWRELILGLCLDSREAPSIYGRAASLLIS